MLNESAALLELGLAQAFPLPSDRTCASVARSTLSIAMTQLALPDELISDATVAVSELATNALLHAGGTNTELWIWPRIDPAPALVVTVFDTGSGPLPHAVPDDLLSESGRGLSIVAALTTATGAHRSRSRLRTVQVSGKATWFTLALPDDYPLTTPIQSPQRAAHLLLLELYTRGLFAYPADDVGDGPVLVVNDLRIQISRTHLTWRNTDGTTITHQLPDLQDSLERIVSHFATRARQ
ncbi:ATP-binding protein [Spirillospora sp. NPDC052269]